VDHRAGNDVFELADVSGPAVTLKAPHHVHGHSRDPPAQVTLVAADEEPDQLGNVFRPIPQWRQRDREHAETVEEVGPEPSLLNRSIQINVGRGDHAHVHATRLRRPDPLELAFLQHAEELGLQLERKVADFVQEDRAAVGQLEPPLPHGRRASECAALVAEQLAFDQRGGQRRAVDANELVSPATAAVVYGAREELLTGAGFAEQQHRGIKRRDLIDALEHDAHRRAGGDDAVVGRGLRGRDRLTVGFGRGRIDRGNAAVCRGYVLDARQAAAKDFTSQPEPLDDGAAPVCVALAASDDQAVHHA